MDEYLQYMKTLRSHMNDAEDQAAKISAEEQMQMTNIHTLESDINSAKSEIAQVVGDTEKMNKSKVEICSTIMENQKKLAALESDSSRLTQTMELIRQEKVGLSAKFSERRAYYSTVAENMVAKFEKQQEWIRSKKISRELKEHKVCIIFLIHINILRSLFRILDLSALIIWGFRREAYVADLTIKVGDIVHEQRSESEGRTSADDNRAIDKLGIDAKRDLITELDSAKERLDEILAMKSKIPMDIEKIKLAIEDVKCRENEFKPELKAADITAIEEEYNALLSDKAGETEYLQSMEKQVGKLKDICHEIQCACGEKYTVALNIQ
ncbi:uncharacterized protein LOC131632344 [Vicia villosa]|uniref:uncharacterized protein LOC131632344 n=1 Tax=Vicia villosa TaxID=3911 RepID=UPI00273C767A|nr:uncharacterized protein LOC131632344 [Vicia villosa]